MHRFLTVLLVLLLLASCTTSSPYNRGSLSDAMDKARDDYPDDREVETERDKKPWWHDEDDDEEIAADDDYTGGSSAGQAGAAAGPVYLGVRGGNAWRSSPYFDSLLDVELLLGYGEGEAEVLVFGGLKFVEAKEESDIAESIDSGVIFLRAGIEGRYYPFGHLTFLSPYVLGQVGGLYMYWSFKNPIDAGTETIFGDAVGGMILAAGAGVNLIDTDDLRVGLSCIPETHLFTSETHKGFQNDVFDYYGTVRWAIEAGIVM